MSGKGMAARIAGRVVVAVSATGVGAAIFAMPGA
jgi:hypothetical protein